MPEKIPNFNLISVLDLSWEGFNKEASPRPFHALSYRIQGNSIFKEKQNEIAAKTGNIFFVPEGIGYTLNAKKEHLYCVHFTGELDFDYVKAIRSFMPKDKQIFELLFQNMYRCWAEKKTGYVAETTACFYRILSKLQLQENDLIHDLNTSLMQDVIDYIHEHFTDSNLSVSEICKTFYVSESFFRKQFKTLTGQTPLEYVVNLRIGYAAELLQSGYYKVFEIAEKSGFSDSKYFSIVFKKKTGKSPKKFAK